MDPRTTQANDRVVARSLARQYPHLRPVDPIAGFYICHATVDLRPDLGGKRVRQLRYGDSFEVLEVREGYVFGYANGINHVGWIPLTGIQQERERSGERKVVSARQTHAYRSPDLKSEEKSLLPHLAVVKVTDTQGSC